jgi:adenylate cyclase
MGETTTGALDAVDTVDRAALQKQRMVALTNLLYLLMGGPMIAFGLGFWLILGDRWLGAEIIAGLGQFLAFVLSRRGHHSAARLLGCALVALVYVDLIVALGVTAGVELWSIPMIAIPPLLTLPSERRLLIGIYALFAATLILAHAALLLGEPRIILDPRFAALMRATNLLLTMGFVGIMVIFYFVRINRAEAAISRERERAERLLANILPAAISARLKREERPIADQFDEVSVLFADIVGFSGFAAAHDPATVVNLLNALFYAFDDMVERRGLEKIKTIGDAYMVAAGIPTPRADHASAIVDLAAEMIAFTDAMRRTRAHDIDLRIGIHSGRVVAGVIGKHKFSYDLWGDTVNMASRLQTTSEPGRIQISSETAQRLGPRYARQLRGAVELKGLGAVETYFLLPGSGDAITRAPG